MKTIQKIAVGFIMVTMFMSCGSFMGISSKYTKDPVCGMKVEKSKALSYEYEGTKVYFDKDECKQAFIMNPKKFFIP
jgi:YHS domain-containing protein